MSKPTKKPDPKPASSANASNKTMAERDEEAIERMVSRFLVKKEEKPVDKYFRALVRLGGSDLHMKVGKELKRDPIEIEEMARLLFPMMNERTRDIFDEEGGSDFAYVVDVDGVDWRFRAE